MVKPLNLSFLSNKGDAYNKFSYSLLDSRYEMYERFRKAVAFRKTKKALHIYDPRVIDSALDIVDVGEALKVTFLSKDAIAPSEKLVFYFNPSSHQYEDRLDKDDDRMVTIPPRRCVVVDE